MQNRKATQALVFYQTPEGRGLPLVAGNISLNHIFTRHAYLTNIHDDKIDLLCQYFHSQPEKFIIFASLRIFIIFMKLLQITDEYSYLSTSKVFYFFYKRHHSYSCTSVYCFTARPKVKAYNLNNDMIIYKPVL